MRAPLIALVVVLVGCGTVTQDAPAAAGGAGGAGATAGAGAELGGHSGDHGDGGQDGELGAGGATGGSAGAPATGGAGGTNWPACLHPITNASNRESGACWDTCQTTATDDAGLQLGDNFGFCVGILANQITCDSPSTCAAGSTIYCRQTMAPGGGPPNGPKETPDAGACP